MKSETWALSSAYIKPRLSNSREKESEQPGKGLCQHSRGLIQDREQILRAPAISKLSVKISTRARSEIFWADTVSYPCGDSELQHLGVGGTLTISLSGMAVGNKGFGSSWTWVQVPSP